MRGTTIALISALATIGIVACADDGEANSEPVEVTSTTNQLEAGPAVGEAIPAEFSATDMTGEDRSLENLSGENGLVLVFNRSADWCGYCQAQMVDLNAIADDLEERGYTLAAMTYDTPDVLAEFAERESIGYTLLSDEGSEMIDAFDLRDPQYGEESFAYGVPRPTILVIGTNGTVRVSMIEEDYRVRPDTGDILAAIDAL